jgi:hypothetical protein
VKGLSSSYSKTFVRFPDYLLVAHATPICPFSSCGRRTVGTSLLSTWALAASVVTLRLATGANLRALGAAAALGAKRESMAGWASSTARAVCG